MGHLWEVEMRKGRRIGLLCILFGIVKTTKKKKPNSMYYFGFKIFIF